MLDLALALLLQAQDVHLQTMDARLSVSGEGAGDASIQGECRGQAGSAGRREGAHGPGEGRFFSYGRMGGRGHRSLHWVAGRMGWKYSSASPSIATTTGPAGARDVEAPDVEVVLPAYNESARLPHTLRRTIS